MFFDAMFSGMMAFQQVGMFIGAWIMIGLGGLLAASYIRCRFFWNGVDGEVIGVKQKGQYYYPVFRYTAPNGEQIEAVSNTGSTGRTGMETGRKLRLYHSPDRPTEVETGGMQIVISLVGLIFLLPGLWLLKMSVMDYPVTPMTWIVAFLLAAFFAMKISKGIIPKDQRGTLDEWKAARDLRRQEKFEKKWVGIPTVPLEDILCSPEGQERLKQEEKQKRFVAPIMVIIALGMMWGGYHQSEKLILLEKSGIRAEGKVIEMKSRSSDDGYVYYPVVRFSTSSGKNITFDGKSASNPPMYDTGEKVTVLYLENSPKNSAIIDHGFWNWILPGVLGAIGFLFFFLGLRLLRQAMAS